MKRDGTSQPPAVLRTLAAALALAVPAVALATRTDATQSSTRPPTNLKLVGDHWTPWDPPTPPDGAEVYIIVKGDTLWDLAQRDLGDPYLWPQIWDQNRYILDSHWIYPGDPLMMPGPVTVVAEETTPPEVDAGGDEPVEVAMEPPVASGQPQQPAWGKPNPGDAADRTDMLCSGYILEDKWSGDTFLYAGEEEHKIGFGPGEVMYMNKGLSSGVKAGDKFFVVHRENAIDHPVTGRKVGYIVRRMGVAQVMTVQAETATVALTEGCDTVHIGYDLIPYTELRPPKRRDNDLARYGVEDNGRPAGHVIYAGDSQNTVGEGDIVYIDMGMSNGVEPGDYLMVYRDDVTGEHPNEAGLTRVRLTTKSTIPAFNTRKIRRGEVIPRKMLGEMVILAANQNTATAKITYSWREIYWGDQVQLLD